MLKYSEFFLIITVFIPLVICSVSTPEEGLSTVRRSTREATGAYYKSFTSLAANGRKKTALWYFNPNGPNYKLFVYGGLPAPDEEMVDWLENNYHRFKVIPVPYEGDAKESPATGPLSEDSQPAGKPKPFVTKEKPSSKKSLADSLFPSDCGQRLLRIVEGKEAQIEEYPWQVALIDKKSKGLRCGGSLITNRHVVTAAHCFEFDASRPSNLVNKENRLVVAGLKDLSDREDEFAILHLFMHGSFNKETLGNDIALIMIEGEFTLGIKIYPICLPSLNENLNAGRECKISGWGRTSARNRITEIRLRAAVVNVTTDEQCKEKNSGERNIGIGMFCAGNFEEGGADTCKGDSGGPLACDKDEKFTLFGVTSWGISCGSRGYPGVYTKVSNYVDWIKEAVEESLTL